jgi:adenosylcobinamide-GDP ribazoletransferase
MIGRIKSELTIFALALQFLIRVPVPVGDGYTPGRFAASVRHYPLVGMVIGGFAAATYALAALLFPPLLAVLLSTALTLLATGAFHEDGLADTVDGIGGGVTAERSLEIMKDSRIGVFGAAALVMVLAIKIAALQALPGPGVVIALVAAHGLSRWSSVLVIATSSYVRAEGTAKPVAAGINLPGFVYASLVAVLCVGLEFFLVSPPCAAGAALGLGLGHTLSRAYFERKLGGYTGDCLGATQQVSEIGVYLGVLACL